MLQEVFQGELLGGRGLQMLGAAPENVDELTGFGDLIRESISRSSLCQGKEGQSLHSTSTWRGHLLREAWVRSSLHQPWAWRGSQPSAGHMLVTGRTIESGQPEWDPGQGHIMQRTPGREGGWECTLPLELYVKG